MKASTCDLKVLGERMKSARESVGLTQAAFHEKYGYGSVRSYQKNEAGANEAGICLVSSFVRAGINANWLLTGEGPMLLADLKKPTEEARMLDSERLKQAVESAEDGLAAARRVMAPGKKAELILAIYVLMEEPAVTKERVLKLVKFAV